MKHQQKGYAWRVKKSWHGRWYVPTIGENGEALWEQHSEKLCEGDQYRRRKDVQPLLDQLLAPLNNGRATPEATLTIAEYGDQHFMTWAERELKPSTVDGYQKLWKKYLRPRLGDVSLRDFRCVHATNLLATIHRERPVGRLMLRHCKALLRTIFTYAKRNGVIDGMNPIKDAGIPRAAKKAAPTHAYTTGEVLTMLNVLDGVARASIAVMFFCGLRPGEARAIRWNDYDAEKAVMRVRASMWNCHLTEPKTEQSAKIVPVAHIVAEILAELPHIGDFILAGPTGVPVDLHNLAAREIRPALAKQSLAWHGFYALRRGCATLVTSVESPLAAKSLLRHANIATTQQHYIKSVPAEALRAVDKISALVDNAADGQPN